VQAGLLQLTLTLNTDLRPVSPLILISRISFREASPRLVAIRPLLVIAEQLFQ